MDRGAWGGYSPWGHKQWDMTEQLTLSQGGAKMAEDIRHPEKQPNSSKGGRKKYKRQKKRQKREGWSSVPGRES